MGTLFQHKANRTDFSTVCYLHVVCHVSQNDNCRCLVNQSKQIEVSNPTNSNFQVICRIHYGGSVGTVVIGRTADDIVMFGNITSAL